MSILHDGLLGALLGGTPPTNYDVGFYQQKAMWDILGQYQGPFGYPLGMAQFSQQRFNPSTYQAQQASMAQQQVHSAMCNPMNWIPPRKHVESREVTGMEKARKQINGAVQAVKDAQIK